MMKQLRTSINDEDDSGAASVPLLQDDNAYHNKQKEKTSERGSKTEVICQVVGSFNLVSLLLAVLLAVFCGFLVVYGFYLALYLIDEILIYDDLYIKHENITLYPCIEKVPSSFSANDSEIARQAIETGKSDAMKKFIITLIVYIISSLLAQSLWTITLFRLMKKLRFGLFKQLLSKELSWYDTHPSSDLSLLMTDCTNRVEQGLEKQLFVFFEYIGIIVSALIFLYYSSWQLAISSTIPLILVITFIFIITKIYAKRAHKMELFHAKAISIAEEVFSSIRTVVTYGGKIYTLQRFSNLLTASSISAGKLSLLFVCSFSFLMFIANSNILIVYGFGYQLYTNCTTTIEEIASVALLYTLICGSLFCEYGKILHIARSLSALQMISKVYEQESKSTDDKPRFKHTINEGTICFCNVSFTYPSRPDVTVLHGVDFQVESGKSVAIIGPSGCGKTTIINLLLGLYESHDGSITVDNIDLQYIDQLTFRKQIGLVSQEPALFNVSIYDNICYGNPEANLDMIENAAKLANIHDFVLDLPNGYNTIVGEGGIKLSGGQKQRVAIARALVRNPKILLLDEATSALDKMNEKTVQEALNNAMRGRTTLIIAHRLSTVRNADVIIGIENGYIVERGTHDELMDRKGLYHKLMMKQQQTDEMDKTRGELLAHESDHEVSLKEEEQHEKEVASKHHELNPQEGFFLLMKKYTVVLYVIFGNLLHGFTGVSILLSSFLFGVYAVHYAGYEFNGDRKKPIIDILILASIAITTAIVVFFSKYIVLNGGGKLVETLQCDMLEAMLKHGVPWFDQPENAVGILTTKLTVDPSTLLETIGYPLMEVFEFLFAFPTMVILLFVTLWRVALIIVPLLSIVPISQILYLAITWTITPKLKMMMQSYGKVAVESVKHVTVVKSLGINDSMESLYKERVLKEQRLKLLMFMVRAFLQSLSIPVLLISSLLLIWMTMDELIGNNTLNTSYLHRKYIRIINMIAAICILYKSSLTSLPSFQDVIMSGFDIAKLIFSKGSGPESNAKRLKPEQCSKTISFHDVGFVYPTRPHIPVLTNVNISVEEGQTLAIVGASGSGKTTIVSLLERFYEPSSGVIRLGDHDISDLDIDWLRQQISLVSQEPVLFNMSIGDNIRYGALHKTVTDEEIVEAAKTAKIHEFISSLPQGYETVVGLRAGHQLSGGQKQRVAIARAVIQDPKILLLDEATSSLDTENEMIVQEALNKARMNRTTIVIAHRLSTIQDADKIVVLSEGKVVEEGSHLELMNSKGLYYEMNQ